MESVQATRLRKGMLIKMNANLFRVLELNHMTPGNKRGFVQTKMRNIRTGTLTDHKFSSGESVERALLDSRKMQFLYADGEGYHFMDTESYEQVHLAGDTLGDAVHYLLPEATITVEWVEDDPVGIALPADGRSRRRRDGAGDQGARPPVRSSSPRVSKPVWSCRCPHLSPTVTPCGSTPKPASTSRVPSTGC